MHLIEVEYEPLPTLMTIDQALKDGSPRIQEYGDGHNIHKMVSFEFGDVEEGFRAADLVREDVFFFEGNTHLPMEQHAAVAQATPDGKVTLWSSTQTPHYVHRALGKVLGLPMSHIRVDRHPERRRLRREVRPLQPRDGRLPAGPAHRAAGEDHADPRGGLLHSPRPPPGADVDQVGRPPGRADRGDPVPLVPGRRRLRLVRGRLDVLHGRAADRDLQGPPLQVRGRARLHEQAAVRPQAGPRDAPAAVRPRGATWTRSPSSSASTRPRCGGATRWTSTPRR